MPFPSALSAGNLTSLRGSTSTPPTWSGEQYLCLGANTVIFAALVNGTPSGASFAQVSYDNVTTGAFGDIENGMTVLISATNDVRAAYFTGRVRKTPTAAILYINETSAAITDNHYIFVLRDWRVWEKLARVSGGVYYKDFDLTYATIGPLIAGIQTAYAGIVSGSPAGYTVAFSASATAVTSGATISSYAWTIPTGGTVTAGATNTANVTVRFDAAAAEYWVKLVVTDSNSKTTTRWVPVFAIPADLSTTVKLSSGGVSVDASLDNGWSASIPAFDGVSSVLDNTLAVIFTVERYNAVETNLVTNVNFVGRLRTEASSNAPDPVSSRVQEIRYDLESPFSQLVRTAAPLIKMRYDASPTVWDELNGLTMWRGIAFLLLTHTTFPNVNSVSFDSTANTFYYDALATRGSNMVDAIQDFCQSINAAIEFAASGEMRIARDARYLTTAERAALTTVANWTTEDATEWTLDHQHIDTVGQVKAYGGVYNTTSDTVQVVASYWPGTAQGPGSERVVLNSQVLAANATKAAGQSELNRRIGYESAVRNNRDTLTVTHPDGYHWIIPSVSQWYTWTLASTDTTGGHAFTTSTRWLVESISWSHDPEAGERVVRVVYIKEQTSSDGRTYNPPAPGATTPALPSFPPFNPYPAFPDLPIILPGNTDPTYIPPGWVTPGTPDSVPTDGNSVVIASTTQVWVTKNFLPGTTLVNWQEVTPLTMTGTIRSGGFGFGKEFYLLESDGVYSHVWYCPDIFASEPAWVDNGSMTGVYTIIRPTSTAGAVYVYGQQVSAVYDWCWEGTAGALCTEWSTGYFLQTCGAGILTGHTFDTTGTTTTVFANRRISGTGVHVNAILVTFDAVPDVSQMWVNLDHTGSDPYSGTDIGPQSGYTIFADGFDVDLSSGDNRIEMSLAGYEVPTGQPPRLGSVTKITLYGTGTPNPSTETYGIDVNCSGGILGPAETRYSTDYGVTFAAAVTVGTFPTGEYGMDVNRIGTPVIASADGLARKATSGGAFADYGAKAQGAIFIPRFVFGSTSSGNTGTTPEYLLAAGAADGGETVWKVTSSGGTHTAITPTIGGNDGLAVSPDCVVMPWRRGDYILAVLSFGGTPRMIVSVDTGANWTDGGVIDAAANYVRVRRGDSLHKQAFITNGGPAYIPNYRAGTISIYTRNYPSTDDLILIEPYG